MRVLALAAATLFLFACPKRQETFTVTGTADQQMDQYVAKLEELRSRMQAATDGCPDNACAVANEGCKISQHVCELAQKNPDRTDFQDRCGRAQEDCAQFNGTCSRCQ